MRMIITTILSLFTLYSSRLMAHPYVSEADIITKYFHETFHVVSEKGLFLLFVILELRILEFEESEELKQPITDIIKKMNATL